MGAAMPVRATAEERKRFAFRALILLEMPPRAGLAGIIFFLRGFFVYLHRQSVSTQCIPTEQSSPEVR